MATPIPETLVKAVDEFNESMKNVSTSADHVADAFRFLGDTMRRSGKSQAMKKAALRAAIYGERVLSMGVKGEKNETDILKPFEPMLLKAIEEQKPVFVLNQPSTVTVKKRNGSFSKIPLIGDERFEATSCYMGKRDGMIFVLKPIDPADYAFMEMNATDARDKLTGFNTFVEGVIDSDIDEAIVKAKENAAAAEAEEYVKVNESKYGSQFGSW